MTLPAELTKNGKPPVKRVNIPGGATGYVRRWGGMERCRFMAAIANEPEGPRRSESYITRVLLMSLSDEAGNRLLGDNEAEQLDELSPEAAQSLLLAAVEFNALEEAQVEELEKNSDGSPSDAGGTS